MLIEVSSADCVVRSSVITSKRLQLVGNEGVSFREIVFCGSGDGV